jgi:predicted ATPase
VITTIAVEGYRSLRKLIVPLAQLTVITGANGSGKSSLYRALRLIAETAHDGAVRSIAMEGGLGSTLWAGPEEISRRMKRGEVPIQYVVREHAYSLKLGFAGDDVGYAVDFGQPSERDTAFASDPEIKAEVIWHGPVYRRSAAYLERKAELVKLRTDDGWRTSKHQLASWSSVLSEIADAEAAPEIFVLRQMLRSWRFYDQLRTDMTAPARQPAVGTRTPVLSGDGGDLAAAIQTIREMGGGAELDAAVELAFPGTRVDIGGGARFELQLRQHGLLRPLEARELSDGTLRYLLLVAALLSPRPAALLVLNEPETSLHPDLIEPLAALIVMASARSQIIVVSHSKPLVAALAAAGALRHELVRETSETSVAGQGLVAQPPWHWPMRDR